ncbi:MAG: hypothetical protein FI737_00360 [SAR202 cluster bacterium]|jgi:hypothetical protein|nr:hypothetical protein [Dehalococcoidia bacterium]MQF87530.1 hypothetical protein [SAR202 cluster bacterium]|tara:strand:- start:16386 stop:17294 length:909 start_codon:yes stop_codon:yes gene_type:complete
MYRSVRAKGVTACNGPYLRFKGTALDMDLIFDNGESQNPRGHALLYFRVDTEPGSVYATYVVTLPVKSDLTKYVPPFLASHLGNMPLSELSAFAMPPVPEAVGSFAELERLSQLRGDDLVYGGSMFSFDLARMMETATEAVQVYSSLCSDALAMTSTPAEGAAAAISEELRDTLQAPPTAEPEPEPEEEPDESLNVNEVLFSFMSESDKLGELSKLLGRLRFAVDGSDQAAADEVSVEITVLARHLPESFKVGDLLEAAKDNSERSSQLAKLYIDRCFRLSVGEEIAATELDAQIQLLKDQA